MGYVYLIEASDNNQTIYKIGYTKHKFKSRIQGLNTGTAADLKELYKFETKYGRLLETSMHNFLKHKQVKREWFDLDINDVINFLPMCKKIENNLDIISRNIA
jgi:hypothetical protein